MYTSCDSKSAETYYKEAKELSDRTRWEEALPLFDKAIEKYPGFRLALVERGLGKAMWLEKYEEGIKDFEKVLEIDPDNTLALYRIGFVYGDQYQHKKAIEYLLKALETQIIRGIPETTTEEDYENELLFAVYESDIRYQLGLHHVRIKSFDRAIVYLNACIITKSHLQDSYFLLGEAYLGKEDIVNACKNFNESAKLGDSEALQMLKKYCLKESK
jgi:tetratricopeptide (TPR) repeat protein